MNLPDLIDELNAHHFQIFPRGKKLKGIPFSVILVNEKNEQFFIDHEAPDEKNWIWRQGLKMNNPYIPKQPQK